MQAYLDRGSDCMVNLGLAILSHYPGISGVDITLPGILGFPDLRMGETHTLASRLNEVHSIWRIDEELLYRFLSGNLRGLEIDRVHRYVKVLLGLNLYQGGPGVLYRADLWDNETIFDMPMTNWDRIIRAYYLPDYLGIYLAQKWRFEADYLRMDPIIPGIASLNLQVRLIIYD